MVRCFQLLTCYMSFLVQIPLSVLPATYEIKRIETKINWTLCGGSPFSCSAKHVLMFKSVRSQHHSPLLLSLMAAETLAILMELQYPLPQARIISSPKVWSGG